MSYHTTTHRSFQGTKKPPAHRNATGGWEDCLSLYFEAVFEAEDQSSIVVSGRYVYRCHPEPIVKFCYCLVKFVQFKHKRTNQIELFLPFIAALLQGFGPILGNIVPIHQGAIPGGVFTLILDALCVFGDALFGQCGRFLKFVVYRNTE